MDLAELVPVVGAHSRTVWRAAGQTPGHEDCNGRMPNIAKDVFTKMDDRRDRGEDEEEIDYVSWDWTGPLRSWIVKAVCRAGRGRFKRRGFGVLLEWWVGLEGGA